MAVFRVEKTKDFTVMSNHHLRNAKLSLKAKGLLSPILKPHIIVDRIPVRLQLINKDMRIGISLD